MKEICIVKFCKDCPEQVNCFGCEHNYILVKAETSTNLYKCTKCGNKVRLSKKSDCLQCIWNCKGEVETGWIDKKNGVYRMCGKFRKREEEWV